MRVVTLIAVAACLGCHNARAPVAPADAGVASTVASVPMTLSGQVFDVISEGRVAASDVPLIAVVRTVSGCAPPCTSMTRYTYENTTSGPDGRYHFANLPGGSVVVLANSATHRQVCGAFAELSATTRLDVEITSKANPQPSPTLPPLRVTGQMYETTPSGRVGVAGAVLYIEWANDAPFLYVYADAEGRYTACGIPANRRIAFWPLVWHQGYDDPYDWHEFSGDTTFDIELHRR